MQLERELRDYQKEADIAIYNELFVQNKDKCLVKMFWGDENAVYLSQLRK